MSHARQPSPKAMTLFAKTATGRVDEKKDEGVILVNDLINQYVNHRRVDAVLTTNEAPSYIDAQWFALSLSIERDKSYREKIFQILEKNDQFALGIPFMDADERSKLYKQYLNCLNTEIDEAKFLRACAVLVQLVNNGLSAAEKRELIAVMLKRFDEAAPNDAMNGNLLKELIFNKRRGILQILKSMTSLLSLEEAKQFLPILQKGMDDSTVRVLTCEIVDAMRRANLLAPVELETHHLPRGEIRKNSVDAKSVDSITNKLNEARRSYDYTSRMKHVADLEVIIGGEHHQHVVKQIVNELNTNSRDYFKVYYYEFLAKAYAKSDVQTKAEIQQILLSAVNRSSSLDRRKVMVAMRFTLADLPRSEQVEFFKAVYENFAPFDMTTYHTVEDKQELIAGFCTQYIILVREHNERLQQQVATVAAATAPAAAAVTPAPGK